jgi:hypothetical protein
MRIAGSGQLENFPKIEKDLFPHPPQGQGGDKIAKNGSALQTQVNKKN